MKSKIRQLCRQVFLTLSCILAGTLVVIVSFSSSTLAAQIQKETKIEADDKQSLMPISERKIEVIPPEIGKEIIKNLRKLTTLKEHPKGFKKIEDIHFDWISIAGVHTRSGSYENYFLFPYWNTGLEQKGWETGIGLKKDSPIVYVWKIKE